MIKNIDLFEGKPDCSLSAYIHEDGTVRPCVIVCPGGSYRYHAPREAEPIADILAVTCTAILFSVQFRHAKRIMQDDTTAVAETDVHSK